MSLSSDGILFFGINLGFVEDREEPYPWDEAGEYDDFIVAKEGIVREGYEDSDSFYAARHAYLKELGCAVDIHGADSCVGHYIYLESKRISASRGYPRELTKDFFEITDADVAKLKTFCELLEVEWKEPCWVVTSWLG